MRNIVITISRQYGSGGKTIGAMLAKELGINCYSREILRMASEDSGINEKLFGMSDEKVRRAGWFKLLSRPYEGGLIPPEDREFTSDDNLFNYQAKGDQRACGKRVVRYCRKMRRLCFKRLSECSQRIRACRQKVLSGSFNGTSQHDGKRDAEIY